MEIQTKQQEKSQGSDTSHSRFSQVAFKTKWRSNNKKYTIKYQKYTLFSRILFCFQKSFTSDLFYNIATSLA